MKHELSLISVAALAALGLSFGAQGAAALPEVSGVELQPLAAQVKRVTEALDYLGAPLSPAKQQALEAAMAMSDEAAATRSIQASVSSEWRLDKVTSFSYICCGAAFLSSDDEDD